MKAAELDYHPFDMERVLAVINPRSGWQLGLQTEHWMIDIAHERGIQLSLRETRLDRPAGELVADARAFDRVVVSGGDGTLAQVFGGLVGTNVPLAIVPSGTGNVLGQAVGVNPDLRQACDDALNPECGMIPLDLGLLNDRVYFALRLSVGYEALVTRDTTRELKTRFGKLAYLWQAVRHALHLPATRYRIDVDGQVLRRRAESVWVANTSTLGILGLQLDPIISLCDRQLDLCLFRFTATHDLRRVLRWLLQGERLPATVVTRYTVQRYVNIVASSRQPVQVDGDATGETPCRIRVVPVGVLVCTPRKV
jgi:diacylglycerol kinase family enzyme